MKWKLAAAAAVAGSAAVVVVTVARYTAGLGTGSEGIVIWRPEARDTAAESIQNSFLNHDPLTEQDLADLEAAKSTRQRC